jgi:hypothetical protein
MRKNDVGWVTVTPEEVGAGAVGGTAATAVMCLAYEDALRELVEKADAILESLEGLNGCDVYEERRDGLAAAITKAKELLGEK